MNAELNVTTLGIFLLVVFPGLVSITIYRLIMPARALEWDSALLQGLFYSAINFVLALPILFWLVFGFDPLTHPIRYSVAAILVLVVMPITWPILLVSLFKSKRLARKIRIPYPTVWDSFFDQRKSVFVLVHLNSGKLLGGFFGRNSSAGSFPNDGDIYLQAVYTVTADGRFRDPKPNTRGVLLRKEQCSYIELFGGPKTEDTKDAQAQQRQGT